MKLEHFPFPSPSPSLSLIYSTLNANPLIMLTNSSFTDPEKIPARDEVYADLLSTPEENWFQSLSPQQQTNQNLDMINASAMPMSRPKIVLINFSFTDPDNIPARDETSTDLNLESTPVKNLSPFSSSQHQSNQNVDMYNASNMAISRLESTQVSTIGRRIPMTINELRIDHKSKGK